MQQQPFFPTNTTVGSGASVTNQTGMSSSYQQQGIAGNPQQTLTAAGVSNISQQFIRAEQDLQKVHRDLSQAQNQVQVQAEGQIRQLKQLQQSIEQAVMQVQQLQSVVQGSQQGYSSINTGIRTQ